MLRKKHIFMIAPLLFTAACSTTVDPTNPYDPAAPESIQAKGEVKGSVTLEGGGDPSGVTVALQGVSGTALTDAQGGFSIKDVRAGVYVLAVVKDGFKDLKVQGVNVVIGKTTDMGQLLMDVGRGLVRGQVSLKGSADSGGATVTLKPAEKPAANALKAAALSDTASFAAVSGIDGRWEVSQVPVGWYYLLVSKDGYQTICPELVNILKDGEEKSGYAIELVATSALVSFSDSGGVPLPPYAGASGVTYYTGSRELKAVFNGTGVLQIRSAWSEAGLESAEWEPYAVQKDVAMDAGEKDGEKHYWVEMKDQCKLTRKYSQRLVLDTTAPETASLDVQGTAGPGGVKYIKDQSGQATVLLHAEDKGSGIEGYRLSVDREFTDEPFVPVPSTGSIVVGLGAEDREYKLRAEYRDLAGNKTAVEPMAVRLDRAGPGGTLSVVGLDPDGNWIGSTQLDLTVSGADPAGTDGTPGSGVAKMKIWNEGESEPGNWTDVSAAARWSIPDGEGAKSINLKLQDLVGNPSGQEIKSSFNLYTTGPVSGTVSLEGETDHGGVLVAVTGFATTALSANNGTFLISGVPQGIRDVSFSKAAYKTVVIRSAEVKAKKGLDTGAVPMLKSRGSVYGKAKLEDNSNSSGIVISLAPGNFAGYTDPDGNYRMDGIPVGTYSLTASKEGYATQTILDPVVVTEDGQTKVDVPNLQKISAEFTILDQSAGNPHNTTYTKSLAVKLIATPPQNYAGVCVAESGKYATVCIPEALSNANYKSFTAYENFTLDAGDGARELQARWLDAQSKSLALMKGNTTLDTVPPVVDSVLLNGGAKYINNDTYSSNVTVTMAAHDVTSSVFGYRYKFAGQSYHAWTDIAGAVTVPWEPSGDGVKTVTVRFRDMAGNESSETDPLASASITVDTSRPSGTKISIQAAYTDSGTQTKYVKNTLVTIDLTKNGAVGLKLSNDGNFDFADYRNVSSVTSISWELTPGDATKTVYARFYNEAGNYTNTTISDTVVLDTTPPSAPSVSIAEAPLTNKSTVTANVSATGASHFAVRTDTAFAAGDWKTYPPAGGVPVTLSGGDGLKTVYAKFKDNLGNETQLVMATVQLDQTAPSNGSVKFAANPTNSLSQTLALFAIGATKMCLYGSDITGACDPATATSLWPAYNTSTTVTLQTGNASKTVKVKFADDAGNSSIEYSDTTLLDTDPPVPDVTTPVLITGKVKNTAGADVDNTSVTYLSSVSVTLKATGATRVALSNSTMSCNSATYVPVTFTSGSYTATGYLLQSGTGSKTVYACFRNDAGNVTSSPSSGTIYLDQSAPVNASFAINSGAAYSISKDVSLTGITFTDDQAGQTYMMFSNCVDFAATGCATTAWVNKAATYPPTGTWELKDPTGADGARTVYMKTRDFAGNEGSITSATIYMDLTKPTGNSVTIVQKPTTNSGSVDLILNSTGATRMCIYGDIGNACSSATGVNTWPLYATTKVVSLNTTSQGAKYVRVVYADEAGNKADEVNDSTNYDTDPPVPDATTPVLLTGKVKNTSGTDVDNTSVTYLSSISVTLKATGATRVALSNSTMSCNSATYVPVTFTSGSYTATGYLLQSGTGSKTVYACFRDDAGNVTSSPSSGTIYLDQSAPVNASFAINSGAAYSISKDVSLTGITFTDDQAGQTYMMFSNCVDFAATLCGTTAWVNKAATYPPTGAWELKDPTGADGARTVYMKTRDFAGNEGQITSATIYMDLTKPTGNSVTIVQKPTNGGSVDLILNSTGATRMCIYGDIGNACSSATAVNTWPLYATTKVVTLNTTSQGTKYVRVVFADEAGNKADEVNDSTTYDTDPPVPDVTTPVLITGKVKNTSGADVDNTSVTYLSSVSVTLKATGATKIALSNSSLTCSSATYVPVTFTSGSYTATGHLLQSGTGLKTVYACFRDDAGNVTSSPSSKTIYLDQSAPQNTAFSINGGAVYTSTTAVTFDSITATDDQAGQIYMMFSNCPTFQSTQCNTTAWENLAQTYPSTGTWTLMAGSDGPRRVYLKTRDFAGNESATATAMIGLDTAVPTSPSVTIKQKPTNNAQVNLALSAVGATKLCVYGDITTPCDPASAAAGWQPYRTDMVVTLLETVSPPSTTRTVYAVFADDAGNKTAYSPTNSVKDTTIYDTTAPDNPTLSINSGQLYTQILTVNLTMSAGGSPAYYWVEGDVDPTDTANAFIWKTYSTTGTVKLNGLEGSRTVRVKYKDAAGNESYPAFASIVYDKSTPTGMSLLAAEQGTTAITGYTKVRPVDLFISASDDLSGVAKMQISRCSDFSGTLRTCANNACGSTGCLDTECCTYQAPYYTTYPNYTVYSTAQGTKSLYVRFQNGAMVNDLSNPWSGYATYSIYYDNANPTLTSFAFKTLTVPYTNNGVVDLSFRATDTGSGVSSVIFAENPPGYANYSWDTYAEDTPGNPMTKSFRLTSGEGVKTIKAKARDNSGREMADSGNSLTLTLDMTPPTLVSYQSASVYSNSTTPWFYLDAYDGISAVLDLQVCHVVDGGNSICPQICDLVTGAWQPFSTALQWSITPATEKLHKVYACVRDQAGNMTYNAGAAFVFYDKTAPNTPVMGTPLPASSSVTLNWTAATDNTTPDGPGSGIDHYIVQYGTDPTLATYSTQDASGTTATITGLALHTMYYFRVLSVDKANNPSVPSSIQSAVTGWQKGVLNPKPSPTVASYKPFYFNDRILIPAVAYNQKELILYYCDTSQFDCGSESSWQYTTITTSVTSYTINTELPMAWTGSYLVIGAHGTISATYGDQPVVLFCNYAQNDCTISSSWTAMMLPNTPKPVTSVKHMTLVSNGSMLAAVYGYSEALAPGAGLYVSTCYTNKVNCASYDAGTLIANQWSAAFVLPNSAAASAASSPPAATVDDMMLYVYHRDVDSDLRVAGCPLTTGCAVAGSFSSYNFKLDDINAGAGMYSAVNISAYQENQYKHVTWERYRNNFERVFATCWGNNCGNVTYWSVGGQKPPTDPATQTPLFTSVTSTPADMWKNGYFIRLVWRDPADATIYEQICSTAETTNDANLCSVKAKWSAKTAVDTGYTAGSPRVAYWGPNPMVTIKDDRDMVKMYQPKMPGPLQFAAGPGAGSIKSGWKASLAASGYNNYYGTSVAGIEANSAYIPDPAVESNNIALSDSTVQYYTKLTPLGSDGGKGEETLIHQVMPFAEYTVPVAVKKIESSGAVMCMNADKTSAPFNTSRLALGLGGKDGKGYVQYCNMTGASGHGANCKDETAWKRVEVFNSAGTYLTSCSIAVDPDTVAISFSTAGTLTKKYFRYCKKLQSANNCANIADWSTLVDLSSGGLFGESNVSDGKLIMNRSPTVPLPLGAATLMFRNNTTGWAHIKMCNLNNDCTAGANWSKTDIDTADVSYKPDSGSDTYDIGTASAMYSWDMVTAQTAGQGTGIRLCTCNMALGSPAACDTPAEWTCGWAAKSVRLNQVKLTVINSTQPAILWRDELNGRMVLTYCTGVASTCTGTPPGSDGGYWMHSFLARIATAQGTDRFSISSQWDHLFGEDIYITYMNRGTLYLAEASTTTSLIFDSRTWTTVPLVFDPNLLGPASNSGALRYLYATDSVFLPYAIYNPVTGDVTVKVLLKGSTKRYAGQ